MNHRQPKLFLLSVLLAPLATQAQPPGSPAASPTPTPVPPAFTLPMERSTYFVGESFPVHLATPGALIELRDARGTVVVSSKSTPTQTVWRLDTSKLAAGEYSLRAGTAPETKFILTDTQRSSPGAIFDEWMPDVPWQIKNDKKQVAQYQEWFHQAFREAGIDALVLVGSEDGRRFHELDTYGRYRTMLWANPYTRPNSFVPARVYEPEMENMAQRMLHYAAMNARHPNFGGLAYTWDPTGYDRSMLLVYWGWNEHEKALRAYNKRSIDAIYDDFRKRTGLEPVTTAEFTQYAFAKGKPEWAPAFDLPTAVWMRETAHKMPPMEPAKLAALEKRVDAWARYITSMFGEANAYFQKWVKQTSPSLTGTASFDNEFAPRDGSWQPTAYAPLDFRWVEAWSDQVGGPDYAYQWLFHAALADVGSRAGQPVWIGTVLGWAHHQADYPGRFSRAIAHNLAYNGRGAGFALEGFSNILGGMYEGTNWWRMKGTAGEEDFRLGKEWLDRFAPLQEQSTPTNKVAVLMSLSQYGRQYTQMVFDKPQFNAFITLARLGYTPRFVTEDQIEKGELQGYRALVAVNQAAELPAGALEKIKAFQAAGGKVLLSKNSTTPIPGALFMEVAEPDKRAGRPHNWVAPNILGKPSAVAQNERFDELAPAFRAALGESLRTALIPEGDEQSRISTFSLGAGADATYVVATNDSFVRSPSTWQRREVTLRPNSAGAYSALYDLSEEKYLGAVAPVKAGFTDRTARLYALLSRPVEKLDVRATQQITAGEPLALSLSFLDKTNKPLRAAIPFYVKLVAPGGGTSDAEYYRSTSQAGTFEMQIPTPTNQVAGKWTLQVRSLLDGKVLSLPIEVRAAKPAKDVLTTVETPVIARGDFAATWKNTPSIVAPIFEGPNQAERLAAAREAQRVLGAQGVKVEIIETPVLTTYVKGYDPTPEELAENARAENGEVFGRIKRATVNGNDYFAVKGGYVYGRPVLLFDSTEPKDNPLAEAIDGNGMLWPRASAAFPGAGRATIQIVKSAFDLGKDAVVVQATDGAGLLAGARALANPPQDWLTPGIEMTRVALTRSLSIGRAPQDAVSMDSTRKPKLTNANVQSALSPQPLVLKFDKSVPPLPEEYTEWKVPAPAVSEIPAKLEIPKVGIPYMQEGERWIRADTPGGDWPSDLRFSQATLLKVKVPAAGKYRFEANGLFRFSDRKPATQSTWEDIVDEYMNTVKPARAPMQFEVLLNGKPLGVLDQSKTTEQEVVIRFGTAATGAGSNKITEEAGTQISGVLELPAGEHELLFVHKNIVDGILKNIEVVAAG